MDNNIDSTMSILQGSAFYQQLISDPSSPEFFLRDERRRSVSHRPQIPGKASGPTNGLGFQVPAYNSCEPEFCNFIHNGGLLNFELNTNVMPTNDLHSRMMSKEDEYNGWMDFPKGFAVDNATVPLNDREKLISNGIQDLDRQETSKNKRPAAMGDGVQELKKPCVVSPTKPKSTKSESSTAKKDPLSIAAKNRRERISERLKTLQELVPNGSKVDLVTMLEKAISYVKFLQLQVKVLAADEFWPSQGGKAPELSQVKEALDAILGS